MIESQTAERRGHDLQVLWRGLPSARKFQTLGTALLVLAGALAEVLTVGSLLPLLALLTNSDQLGRVPFVGAALLRMSHQPGGDRMVVGLFALTFVVSGAVRLWLTYAVQATAFGASRDITTVAFAKVVRQPYPFYNRAHSADLIGRFEKIYSLAYNVILNAMQGSAALVLCVALLALLLIVDPRTALIGGGLLVSAYLLVSLLVRRSLQLNAVSVAEAWGDRVRALQEALGGIRDILLDRSQAVFEQRMARAADQARYAMVRNSFINFAPRIVVETVLMLFVAGFGYYLSQQPGGFAGSLPSLGVMALGAMRLLPQVQTAFQGWSSFAGNQQTIRDVADLLRLPDHAQVTPERSGLFADRLELHGLEFGFDDRPVLRNLDLSIRRGERIGIVGPTGSGKSTLMDLLLGLLQPQQGTVSVDGKVLDEARRAWWQTQVAHVPQQIFLLDASIRANVAFAVPEAAVDDALVTSSLRAAGLADFVATLPQGAQTAVGEGGARLSGGQRQRIGIARALYKRASLLIFDEATSALDTATERSVMEAIDNLPGDITVVLIAHRLSTLANCDRIIALDGGRIARIVNSIDEL
ncbi:ABC transporter ATP-binding protein [Sphingomonas ginkgonis]|uniref:ABC transporter ATP-binding protein n=1 Tax=Sphingomonas ginkgonis TaxID=2315330 RepID=A0A429VCQ9_9SPHN|nr:ABC transporter ATP-binding protein [Sphingomonas ginkgonis]RST31779.1 ABC transporter ATP-binding protein [Sphingomonas ginkgonis]